MSANSKGSGETVLMRSLTRDFAGRLCDKYPGLFIKSRYFTLTKVKCSSKKLFAHIGCMLWNKMPIDIRIIQLLRNFKIALHS